MVIKIYKIQMKKRLAILAFGLALVLSTSHTYAQKFTKFAIGINNGVGLHLGDADMDGVGMYNGINMKYSFANRFALKAEFGSLNTNAKNMYFKSKTSSTDYNLQAVFTLAQFSKKGYGLPKVFSSVYFGMGMGYLSGTITYSTDTVIEAAQHTTYPKNAFTYYASATLGYKAKLSKRLDMFLEYSQKFTRTDLYDGYAPNVISNRDRDVVGVGSIGFQINLGRGSSNIEWTSGFEGIYQAITSQKKKKVADPVTLNAAQKRIDSLSAAFAEQLKPLQSDSDNDGVPDYFDKEPNSPSPKLVDRFGVSLDTDGDGVADYMDKCISLPAQTPDGCPRKKAKASAAVQKTIALAVKSLEFESGQAVIKQSSFANLNKVVAVLNENAGYSISLVGHTDNTGNSEENLKLSKDRANSVKQYLINNSIAAERISAIGYGDSKPISSNSTEAGRAKNRRVDFNLEE